VVYALRLAQRSQRISMQNIAFSLLVLAVLIPTAILGVIGITAAVFAHEASELIAIVNGLRVAQRVS
jgi:Cd2+/Zn2+-exporting ATPase